MTKETSIIFYLTQWLEYFFYFVHNDNIINETSKTWHTLMLACFYLIELLNLTMHTNSKASNKTLNNLHIYSALWNFTELLSIFLSTLFCSRNRFSLMHKVHLMITSNTFQKMYCNYSFEIYVYSEVQKNHKTLTIFEVFPQISLLRDI